MNNDCKPLIMYVPHGISPKTFYPIDKDKDEEAYAKLVLFKKELLGDKKYDFILFFNSRNIHRKHPSDIMLAYRHFCDTIGKEKADRCLLLMHTQPIDEAGTDLIAVKNALCLDHNVIFSHQRLESDKMNLLYNIIDVTINASSAEGFGISSLESMMCGKPTIVTVTGGLQDQAGFTQNDGTPFEFNENWGSNHDGRYSKHGKWTYPIFPADRSLQGSIPTPYIFDDRCSIESMAEGILFWYQAGKELRHKCGLLGREHAIGDGGFNQENMCKLLSNGIDATLKYWTPKKKFNLYQTKPLQTKSGGFTLKEIDKSKIDSKLKELV